MLPIEGLPRNSLQSQINGTTRPNRTVAKSTAITPCDLIDLRSLWEIIFQIYLSEGYCKYPRVINRPATPTAPLRDLPTCRRTESCQRYFIEHSLQDGDRAKLGSVAKT